ncbi:hypothetical protein SAMN05421788_106160 [Filimonas lacunae]|uniref:Pyridoxamine 5'-phosphate oxidase n=1 Tax=Filimonas lacunae TaxID=477680 RepID=A0A173MEV0_9BACT|nr:pyridoxamine 5'-phosphate oxidase family protein [Filimonas lacunae]BAV06095.1 pyridoxamine 5'-phosphate oxidase-related, FMN-binding [Filimonas lacunae]SIT24630.1 hypothetical protein SAMN05421788_106160 [Filimonas lacunae]
MTGILSQIEIDQVLNGQILGRLGCHADGLTYVVPISYAFDGTWLYGHSGEGMKIAMMRKNPEVCFQADDMQNMGNWKSIVCWGRFEELTDDADRKVAVQYLMARNFPFITSSNVRLSPSWPFQSSDISDVKGILFRILLTRKTGKYEAS